MRVIIAGSRTIASPLAIEEAVALFHQEHPDCEITEVVCGMAPGADLLGRGWAFANKIPVKEMPADWKGFRRSAGFIRNERMAAYANGLIAIWDGFSGGTTHMVRCARRMKLLVTVYRAKPEHVRFDEATWFRRAKGL